MANPLVYMIRADITEDYVEPHHEWYARRHAGDDRDQRGALRFTGGLVSQATHDHKRSDPRPGRGITIPRSS